MSRVPALHLTREEAVTLMLLVGVGGTAFDSPMGIAHSTKDKFEKKFNVTISDQDIANIITKVGNVLKKTGTETVIIDDE